MRVATLLTIGAMLVLSACGGDVREIHVAHYRTTCEGVCLQLCTVSDEEGVMYTPIRGFDYRWGYNYELRVEVQKVRNPPADGSSRKINLLSVLSQERVPEGERFTVPLFDRGLVTDGTTAGHSLLGQRDFDCAANGLCEDLVGVLEEDRPCVDLTLSHPASDDEPLRLEVIEPSSLHYCADQ